MRKVGSGNAGKREVWTGEEKAHGKQGGENRRKETEFDDARAGEV